MLAGTSLVPRPITCSVGSGREPGIFSHMSDVKIYRKDGRKGSIVCGYSGAQNRRPKVPGNLSHVASGR